MSLSNRQASLRKNGAFGPDSDQELLVGLLTGADDPHYAHGLAVALADAGIVVEFIGGDSLDAEILRSNSRIRFLNLRGDQSENVPVAKKILRLGRYYMRLLGYAARTRARIFHILWNNKFEAFDRTLLMMFYRLCRRKVVMTVHNVNVAKRDGHDSWFNRRTLATQYRLCSYLFVHTEKMRSELHSDFCIPMEKILVIPFGLNDAPPRTELTGIQARERLNLQSDELVLLFFGQIAPYKGLSYLVDALPAVVRHLPKVRLIIAGKVKRGNEDYWRSVESSIDDSGFRDRVLCRIEHIPDEDIELYFKAADAVVVPYVTIFQSGVPFLAYSFGLPVLATDVGSLKELIVPGETGFLCKPCDSTAIAAMITRFAESDLFRELADRRQAIADDARERHSWRRVARITRDAYEAISDASHTSGSRTQHNTAGPS